MLNDIKIEDRLLSDASSWHVIMGEFRVLSKLVCWQRREAVAPQQRHQPDRSRLSGLEETV